MNNQKAIVLASGGLDSTVLVYYLLDCGIYPHMLSVNYGQRHRREIAAASQIAERLRLRHTVLQLEGLALDLHGSALTFNGPDVPDGHYSEASMQQTIVPNRNMILLAIAGGVAVAERVPLVAFAAHKGDHAIYPDCRPAFIASMDAALANGTGWQDRSIDGVRLLAPFMYEMKAEIVQKGAQLEVPFADTWSCYRGGERHCGRCGTCVERVEAFMLAGVDDPTVYEDAMYARTLLREKAGVP